VSSDYLPPALLDGELFRGRSTSLPVLVEGGQRLSWPDRPLIRLGREVLEMLLADRIQSVDFGAAIERMDRPTPDRMYSTDPWGDPQPQWFDQVWRLGRDNYLIAEIKEDGQPLTVRQEPSGPAEQGTRAYFGSIVTAMRRNGGAERDLAGQLERALAKGRLTWVIARPVYDADRQLTGTALQVAQLD
jgi:hypothetical protein